MQIPSRACPCGAQPLRRLRQPANSTCGSRSQPTCALNLHTHTADEAIANKLLQRRPNAAGLLPEPTAHSLQTPPRKQLLACNRQLPSLWLRQINLFPFLAVPTHRDIEVTSLRGVLRWLYP